MKFTPAQLNKANKRVADKYGKTVLFNNDLRDRTRVTYTILTPTDSDQYIKNWLESLLNTEDRFDDIYYSI